MEQFNFHFRSAAEYVKTALKRAAARRKKKKRKTSKKEEAGAKKKKKKKKKGRFVLVEMKRA